MTEPAHKLQLTGAAEPRWDDRRWRWALRDSGLIARLAGSAAAVLLHCYALAELGTGEFDLPRHYTASRLELSARTYDRAVNRLIELGLIEPVDPSQSPGRVKRYRLLWPEQKPETRPDTAEGGVNFDAPDKSVAPGASSVSPRGDKFVSPKCPSKASQQSSSSATTTNANATEAAEGTLWHTPAYDRAAAAALVTWGGFAWRVAHGIVTQHRPSRRQVLTVLANAYAWRRAERRGEAPPLRQLQGFIRSEIRRGGFAPDDRLSEIRRARREAARRRRQTAGRDAQHQLEQARAARSAELKQRAEQRYDELGPDALEEYRRKLLDECPPVLAERWARFPLDHPRIRAGIIELITEDLDASEP